MMAARWTPWSTLILCMLSACSDEQNMRTPPWGGGAEGSSTTGDSEPTPPVTTFGTSGQTGPGSASASTADPTLTGPPPHSTTIDPEMTSVGSTSSGGVESSGTEAGESTGQPPEPLCELLSFDAAPPASWTALGLVAQSIVGGALQFEVPPAQGLGILQYGDPVIFDEMIARVQIDAFSASEAGTLGGLVLDAGPGTESVALQLQAGTIEAVHTFPGEVPQSSTAPIGGYPVFLQLRAEAGQLTFEFSADGSTWTTLRSQDRPGFLDETNVNLTVGNWVSVSTEHTVRVAELELCEQ